MLFAVILTCCILGVVDQAWRGELRVLIPGVRQPARLIFSWNPLRLDVDLREGFKSRRLADRRTSFRFASGGVF